VKAKTDSTKSLILPRRSDFQHVDYI